VGRKGTEPNRCRCGHWRSEHGRAPEQCRFCGCRNFGAESLGARPRQVVVADTDSVTRATIGASLHSNTRVQVVAETTRPVEAIEWATDLEADIVVLGFDRDPGIDVAHRLPNGTGAPDDTESECWHCGTVLPLRVNIVAGDRIVLCGTCGKTTRWGTPTTPLRRAAESMSELENDEATPK
jgi:hypothetical protein